MGLATRTVVPEECSWQANIWDWELSRRKAPAPLLQSWAWGDVQSRLGWQVERLRVSAPTTVLLRGSGRLRWGYVPRGPVDPTPSSLGWLVAWAREEGLARLRVEPEVGPAPFRPLLEHLGFQPVRQVQPTHTLIVPLRGEVDLFATLRARTRYNVRLALRRGVEVEEGHDAGELARQVAWSAARNHIRLPGEQYFGLLLSALPWCRTYVARAQGRPLAAALVARHGGRAYYLFAGTARAHPELKPVEALLWTALRSAQQDGCLDFDLWGMPPRPDPRHPWHGFGQFKSGFGGRLVEYAGTWDLVLSRWDEQVIRTQERVWRYARRALRALGQ